MSKKTSVIVLGVVALVLLFVTVLTAAGLWIGVTWMQRQAEAGPARDAVAGPYTRGYGRPGMMGNWDNQPRGTGYGGPGMMWGNTEWDDMPCVDGYGGPGMMGGNWTWGDMPFGSAHRLGSGTPQDMPCGQGYTVPEGESTLSLEDAESAVERYVEQLGYDNLYVTEVMEFERNYYAIVAEEDTGIGAMELLADKSSGTVGPEHGPNMMWNAKYGMHRGDRRGMMWGNGSATGEMTVSATEAEAIAQQWLDANMPGRMAGEPDAFYGYYTLHFLQDGEIKGMLSVHGSSGDVWYHNWHGEFMAMTEHGHE